MSRVLPILFNTEMVRAILDGHKTTTRRLIKPQPKKFAQMREDKPMEIFEGTGLYSIHTEKDFMRIKSPFLKEDTLYVRETWAFATCITCNGEYRHKGSPVNCYDYQAVEYDDGDSISDGCFIYRADHPNPERITWRPSIHMSKAAARIWLKAKDVQIQRIQDMTLDDFLKEGIILRPEAFNDPENAYMQARNAFIQLWDSTVPKGQQALCDWSANPWVWTIEFERCKKPEEG